MNGPGKRSCNRPLEWFGARALLCCGLWMAAFPSSISARFAASLMAIEPGTLAVLCAIVGGSRCFVLWRNGELNNYGPPLRFALSLLSIGMWAQFMIGLLPNLALGIPVYFWILRAEVETCADAARDLNGIASRV